VGLDNTFEKEYGNLIGAIFTHLWNERDNREVQFGDVVNHLQMRWIDPQEHPYDSKKRLAFLAVLEGILKTIPISDNQCRKWTKDLMDARFDVFGELR
jgi:hypothetical protein